MNVPNNVNIAGNVISPASVELENNKTQQSALNEQSIEKSAQNTLEKKEDVAAENKTKASEASKAVVMTPDQLEKVAQQLQDFMGEMNRSLEFSVDKDSGRDVIKVLDKGTGDLVKQYPSEEVLTMISKLSNVTGSLIDTEI
jgi:flagellar protein FlaG|tara:strand:- start:1538 stop:1963 length:426 start_codon:yes stop_codon:yes gene_type:complete